MKEWKNERIKDWKIERMKEWKNERKREREKERKIEIKKKEIKISAYNFRKKPQKIINLKRQKNHWVPTESLPGTNNKKSIPLKKNFWLYFFY